MTSAITTWEHYTRTELAKLTPILERLGFCLDETQVHLGGERAVISGKKVVLLGKRVANQMRVVIKASSSAEGKREMRLEHACRLALDRMPFATTVFLSPELLLWHEDSDLLISITRFIEQDRPFLDRPLQEQFFLALKSFEMQEGAHATTYGHLQTIKNTFRVFTTDSYLKQMQQYRSDIIQRSSDHTSLLTTVARAESVIVAGHERIEQYGGFLTHGDFVPHNIRISGNNIYLLDHYDIRFGNKYDGWARFLNFMLLYHRELEEACVTYLKQNRAEEEVEALHLMRLYRLVELVWYYTQRLEKSTDNLHQLDQERVAFWTDVLTAMLDHTPVSQERINAYQHQRDTLRSEEEKQRQKGLH